MGIVIINLETHSGAATATAQLLEVFCSCLDTALFCRWVFFFITTSLLGLLMPRGWIVILYLLSQELSTTFIYQIYTAYYHLSSYTCYM